MAEECKTEDLWKKGDFHKIRADISEYTDDCPDTNIGYTSRPVMVVSREQNTGHYG